MSTGNLSGYSMHGLFQLEAAGQCAALTESLLALERAPTSATELETCMRAAHSIKGAARIVGLGAAVVIAHAMEDCLVDAREQRTLLRRGAIDALLQGVDLLREIADTPAANGGAWTSEDAPEARAFIKSLAAALVAAEAVPDSPPASPAQDDASDPEPVAVGAYAPQPAPSPVRATGEIGARVIRVTAGDLHGMLGLAGESLVESRWLEPYIRSLGRLKRLQGDTARALERLHATWAIDAPPAATASLALARTSIGESQRLLSDRVTELETYGHRQASVAHRLYERVKSSHMRPFADGTQDFQRMVRDLARGLGKEAHLVVDGETTPVDRDVLEKLQAPLTHLIRNALDHGIEPPAERVAAGKPAEGVIRLDAHHIAGLLEITVSDDGRGIALERVREIVIDRGMVDRAVAQRLTEAELLEFLFLPGFTTRASASEMSGRGVGLDAVQTMVKELRGTVRLSSRIGEGTRFQLQLPLTTSVVKALIANVGGEPYAFPLAQIVSTARVPREDVHLLEGRQHFALHGRQIGMVHAQHVLNAGEATLASGDVAVIVLGDRANGREYALAVDGFAGVLDLVVQPLDPRLGKIKDISAGALLDDGAPTLIVDVDDLVRSVERLVLTGTIGRVQYDHSATETSRRRVLVVDDSLTVRELQRKLLENAGYAVEVAVDGVDGWNALRLAQFDLVITDIDMPRMDGIELVGLVKRDPRLRDVPVMVVSYKDREEDRRRGLEAGADFYLTKGSFQDDTLLQAVADLIGGAAS